MEIRKAKLDDLSRIMDIYEIGRQTMRKNGNDKQWINGFPQKELIIDDIKNQISYVVFENNTIHGVFALISGEDPTYAYIENGSWPNNNPYSTIHRIASDGQVHGLVNLATQFSLKSSQTIRIDTHELNHQMQHTVQKLGYKKCGIIYVDDGSPRIAFQLN